MNIFDNSYDITGSNLIRFSFGSCNLYLEDSIGFFGELPEFDTAESYCYYNSGGTASTCSATADGFASRFCPCSDSPSFGPAFVPTKTTLPMTAPPSWSSKFPSMVPTQLPIMTKCVYSPFIGNNNSSHQNSTTNDIPKFSAKYTEHLSDKIRLHKFA